VQLIAENLVLSRGGREVVGGVSFALKGGEALLLMGPNGAGKTTLLRALAGFLAPTSGRVRFTEAGTEREGSEHLHFVGHLDGLKSHLTVAENLSFWAGYLADKPASVTPERLMATLDRFGLSELADIPASYLSAGQKRRLALARLTVVERPLWLLDEPTVSLDTNAVTQIVEAINEHVDKGGMAVVATHVPLPITGAGELRFIARPPA
jgi:heme exporter protein A